MVVPSVMRADPCAISARWLHYVHLPCFYRSKSLLLPVISIYSTSLRGKHLCNAFHDFLSDKLQSSFACDAFRYGRYVWHANLDIYTGKPTPSAPEDAPRPAMGDRQQSRARVKSKHRYPCMCCNHLLLPLDCTFWEKGDSFPCA